VRTPVPPSSFPAGLQPVASSDIGQTLSRRLSRTDLDFEQALRTGGTVLLKEGVDVNSLGVDASPSPMKHNFGSPSPPPKEFKWMQPATPVVVPPTPSPSGPGSVRPAEPSPASSSIQDVFYNPDDADMQSKRRSLYRSPGTSSSPDLATLLRKAKERGVNNVGSHYPNKRDKFVPDSPPPPLPLSIPKSFARNTAGRTRLRSPTSTATSPPADLATPSKGKPTARTNDIVCLSADISNPASASEWILASPLSQPAK
jgi:PH/SEC7 domain-containing protein